MNFEQQQFQREKAKEREELEASKRPERAEKIVSFLEKINAFEFLQSLDKNSEKIDFEKFKSFLVRLNGIARDIPINKRNFDGKDVEISGGLLGETILPPKAEDKDSLLEYAFDFVEDLEKKDNSYMIPAVINELHMFNDGNGRMSRVIHLLLSSENKEIFDTELLKTLGPDGRFDSLDINPGLINLEIELEVLKDHGWEFVYNEQGNRKSYHEVLKGGVASAEYSKVDSNNDFFVESIEKYRKIFESDSKYLLTATVESMSKEKYESLLLPNGLISPLKMETLSEATWKLIFDNYYELKKDHVKTLVWIFKNPDDYKNPKNEEENLRDLFIRRIREEFEQNKRTP